MAFPTGWGRRCKLTIDHTKVPSTQTDIPVLLTVGQLPSEMFDADGSYPARSDGGDIRISSDLAGANQICVEIVRILLDNDPANGLAEVYVKIPSLSSSVDTEIYLWYNAPSETMPARNSTYGSDNVWTGFGAVYHMNDLTSTTIKDSTTNNNTATGTSTEVNGPFSGSKAQDFNGTTDVLGASNIAAIQATTALTMSWYERVDTWGYRSGWGKGANDWGAPDYGEKFSGGNPRYNINGNDWEAGGTSASWRKIVFTFDGTTRRAYLDGAAALTNSLTATIGNTAGFGINIGHVHADAAFDGGYDELRVAKTVRTADWITVEYNNFSSPSTFSSAGTPETPTSTLTIVPTGIVSAEAFGTPVITTGSVSLSPSSITSAEAFGTAIVSTGSVSLLPSGIGTVEAFGTATVGAGAVTVSPSGIASAEAFGTASLSPGAVSLLPSGIPSAEAFGTPIIGRSIAAAGGIASAEAFGTATVGVGAVTLAPSGIASGEAFGTAVISVGSVPLVSSGIASAEAFGTPVITTGVVTISPTGIPTAEALGSHVVTPGAVTLSGAGGIISAEAFGTAVITVGPVSVIAVGISSGEAFGLATVSPGAVSILPASIPSQEAFGTPAVGQAIEVSGIISGEAFGTAVITTGPVSVIAVGISTSEAFGVCLVTTGAVSILPSGITTAEAFGIPSVSPGAAPVGPGGIGTEEIFGTAVITVGPVDILPSGITTAEAFGAVTVTPGAVSILPTGIVSAEAFGVSSVFTGQFIDDAGGIASGEAFGTALLQYRQIISPSGIVSGESFGTAVVRLIPLSPFFQMLEDDIDDVFLHVGSSEFAEAAVYHSPEWGVTMDINLIFDREYLAIDIDSGAMVQGREPYVLIQSRKLPHPPVQGDWLEIRGARWRVVSSQPDGTGISVVTLNEGI